MDKKNEGILHNLGIIFIFGGLIYIVPLITALIYSESLWAFIIPMLFLIAIGLIMTKLFPETEIYDVKRGMVLASMAWLFLPLIMSSTFIISGSLTIIDSFFESMSGFTSTGLTMMSGLSDEARSILIFRSIIQWIGGVGVIVLFLSVLSRSGDSSTILYSSEGRTDKILPNIISTVRRIWVIYIIYTVICTVFLFMAEMDLFSALNHSMTTLATGGFSINDNSIESYNSVSKTIIIVFMMIGGISFVNHSNLFKGKVKEFFNPEVMLMLIITVSFSLLLSLRHNFDESIFQAVSALTGTGFSTADISLWDDYSKFMMTILMVFGGSYGSTSSAIKMLRILIIFTAIAWVIRKAVSPVGSIISPKLFSNTVEPAMFVRTLSYFAVYLIALLLGAIAFMSAGYSAADSLFEVASAEGNVGLSTGITSPELSVGLKAILIIQMWIGRLEIFPVLVLFYHLLQRSQTTSQD